MVCGNTKQAENVLCDEDLWEWRVSGNHGCDQMRSMETQSPEFLRINLSFFY